MSPSRAHAKKTAPPGQKPLSTLTKRSISILGATLVFLTLLINDAKRERLKEVLGTIESATNAYAIRLGNHTNHLDIRRLEYGFARSPAMNPSSNRSLLMDGSVHPDELFRLRPENDRVGFEIVNGIKQEVTLDKELLEAIKVLVGALPKNNERSERLKSLTSDETVIQDGCDEVINRGGGGNDPAKIAAINKHIYDLVRTANEHSRSVRSYSTALLDGIGKERATAEERYDRWTVLFYCLSGLGWAIGVTGIFIGAGDSAGADAGE
jgi:hypothetical protein